MSADPAVSMTALISLGQIERNPYTCSSLAYRNLALSLSSRVGALAVRDSTPGIAVPKSREQYVLLVSCRTSKPPCSGETRRPPFANPEGRGQAQIRSDRRGGEMGDPE